MTLFICIRPYYYYTNQLTVNQWYINWWSCVSSVLLGDDWRGTWEVFQQPKALSDLLVQYQKRTCAYIDYFFFLFSCLIGVEIIYVQGVEMKVFPTRKILNLVVGTYMLVGIALEGEKWMRMRRSERGLGRFQTSERNVHGFLCLWMLSSTIHYQFITILWGVYAMLARTWVSPMNCYLVWHRMLLSWMCLCGKLVLCCLTG